MFKDQGNLKYTHELKHISIPIADLEEGSNITRDLIVYKDEELIKVYTRKCDHRGGKLCKLKEKITCPLHGWDFDPETGSYQNIQLEKKEENFFIENDQIVVPFQKEILEHPRIDKNYEVSIELLSHACLLIKTKDCSFATDPWIVGFAFSSGWWLSQLPPKNWENKLNAVDFIYISHNHPDHLNQFTLQKIRKDMHFIVPEFPSDSVRKMLERLGFLNITSFDLNSFYKYEDSNLYFSILKSGDFREDSGFYFSYGNFSCLSTVDSNDLNFQKFPEDITLFCSSFAGGASGYPICFDNIPDQRKHEIINRNTQAKKATVKSEIKICKPQFYMPYAGFFNERAGRDHYVKTLNVKNKVSDYLQYLKSTKVNVLDTSVDDVFLFEGNNLLSTGKVERHATFFENSDSFYTEEFAGNVVNNQFIETFFKKSRFHDNLEVYLSLTNDDFSETNRFVMIDFSDKIKVSFDRFDWQSIKDLYVKNSKIRKLHIKVREDSFSWVLINNMPFEDLSIGFQCRIDRKPDIYNTLFWDHFTNIYIS